jgi:DNA-binding MarR family transcriptional regulator
MTDGFEQYYHELEHVAFKVLRRIGHEVSGILDEGMSSAQFVVMRIVGHSEAMTVSEISEYMGVTLSAITSLADRLTASGWLARERNDTDRRLVWLKLTDAGRTKLRELEAKRLELMRKHLGRLPQADLDRLLEICTRLAAITEDSDPPPVA